MNFLEKLDLLLATEKINKRQLSQLSGVPYTTILGYYTRGYEKAQIDNIWRIAKVFGVSLDYLIDDETPGEKLTQSVQEKQMLDLFRQIPDTVKPFVVAQLKGAVQEAPSQDVPEELQ